MTNGTDLPILNPAEARVLGSLIEKKELTPDVYPMTLNALQSAANQKTSRDPVMALEPSDIHRSLKTLAEKGLVRQSFASRRPPMSFFRAASAWRAYPPSRSCGTIWIC